MVVCFAFFNVGGGITGRSDGHGNRILEDVDEYNAVLPWQDGVVTSCGSWLIQWLEQISARHPIL
eukprot:m.91957 g.91957  ORF g.91957 m.91957 type:complete len:65 (+) comp14925_c0_seq3:1157-1351(+)